MKNLLAVALLCALAGCATEPVRPVHAYAQPRDPSQWHVVSVTPVEPGTGARVAASSPTGKAVEYTSTDVTSLPPVYAAAPLYAPAPTVYYLPPPYLQEPAYYYPPVSLSLGFVFGQHWGGGRMRGGWRH